MLKRSLLSIVLLLIVEILYSQANFKAGYVLKLNGDTIKGQIDYRDDNIMSKKCRFRKTENEPVQEFVPCQIKGFRFVDSKCYISKQVDSTCYFLEYLIEGSVSIFSMQTEFKETKYYIERPGDKLLDISYNEYVKHTEEGDILVKSQRHVGILQYYMSDTPQLQKEISEIKIPTRGNLIKLAEKYQHLVCDSVSCIIYEKKLQKVKIIPQVVCGVTNFSSYFEVANVIPLYGVYANVSMPYVSDNLSFKTGLLNARDNKVVFSALKIPLRVEYLYPTGVIRPKVNVGFDLLFLHDKSGAVFANPLHAVASCGANIRLSRKFSLVVDYDINLYKKEISTIIPTSFLSQSFDLGIAYGF